jgi:hypothetical protein
MKDEFRLHACACCPLIIEFHGRISQFETRFTSLVAQHMYSLPPYAFLAQDFTT